MCVLPFGLLASGRRKASNEGDCWTSDYSYEDPQRLSLALASRPCEGAMRDDYDAGFASQSGGRYYRTLLDCPRTGRERPSTVNTKSFYFCPSCTLCPLKMARCHAAAEPLHRPEPPWEVCRAVARHMAHRVPSVAPRPATRQLWRSKLFIDLIYPGAHEKLPTPHANEPPIPLSPPDGQPWSRPPQRPTPVHPAVGAIVKPPARR